MVKKVNLREVAIQMAGRDNGVNYKQLANECGITMRRALNVISSLVHDDLLLVSSRVKGSFRRPMTVYRLNKDKLFRNHLADSLESLAKALRLLS